MAGKRCKFVKCCEDPAILEFYWPGWVEWYCARHYDMMAEYYKNLSASGYSFGWDMVKANGW
jgi:hypothetical protein